MSSSLLFLATPVVLGIAHAFDADHVVAVSTLASTTDRPRHAVRLALLWGLGHALPILGVAMIGLVLGDVVPPTVVAAAERAVGVTLILLGLLALLGMRARGIHIHTHTHGTVRHTHFHMHGAHAHGHQHPHAAVLTGLVHGLAGSAAPIALLPLGAAKSPVAVLAFVGLFGLAVCAGMAVYAFGLGRLRTWLGDGSRLATTALRGSAALVSIVVGAVWLLG